MQRERSWFLERRRNFIFLLREQNAKKKCLCEKLDFSLLNKFVWIFFSWMSTIVDTLNFKVTGFKAKLNQTYLPLPAPSNRNVLLCKLYVWKSHEQTPSRQRLEFVWVFEARIRFQNPNYFRNNKCLPHIFELNISFIISFFFKIIFWVQLNVAPYKVSNIFQPLTL